MTPEQKKHVRPIDPVSPWYSLNENKEDTVYYISSLPKTNRNMDQHEQNRFPLPENPGDEESHTSIQKRILRELHSSQEAEKLNSNDDEESRRKSLCTFDWKNSMLQQYEIKRIESLLVEFHDIFACPIFDVEEMTNSLSN